jgi:hypothetical protein
VTGELVPPPGRVISDHFTPIEVPVERDRNFFYPSGEIKLETAMGGAVIIPIDREGNPMSPYEATTGVALPILASTKGVSVDRHHAHFFKWVYTTGSLGEKALRASRLQRVSRPAHDIFHKNYKGTLLPEAEEEEFNRIILNLASYVPEYGIRINGKRVNIAEIGSRERWALRSPAMFTSESKDTIGQFVMNYALEKGFSFRKMEQVDDFLKISFNEAKKDKQLYTKKLQLGLKLTNTVLGNVIQPLNKGYDEARRNKALRANSPVSAWEVARNSIRGRETQHIRMLEKRLKERYRAAA